MRRRRHRTRRGTEIAPDEIFLDSSNLPEFDTEQFEGRIERPISRRSFLAVGVVVAVLLLAYGTRAWNLMVVHGEAYATQAAQNQLTERIIFADRGAILDRTGRGLAYNVVRPASQPAGQAGLPTGQAGSTPQMERDFAGRSYSTYRGLSHAVGYVKPPAKDSSGAYFRSSYVGVEGAERVLDGVLAGRNGRVLTETDARGRVVSQSAEDPPVAGTTVRLSLDAEATQGLFDAIAARVEQSKFQAGAGVVMDVETGEILALTSYPEYSSQALSDGDAEALAAFATDSRRPFLDRALDGLYAPGSIVKPFVAVAALTEGVIDEYTQILSTGSISVPNPYDPEHPSVFKDWRAHGWVDLRHAIAVSSDVYFYEVGGGFKNQPGLGIARLDQWFGVFGFGMDPGLTGWSSTKGTIPTPGWKSLTFPNDPTWRIGNTYHTAIGQYGMQVTPLQAVRATAALANNGKLLTPSLLASSTPHYTLVSAPQEALQAAREGMRLSVTEGIAGSASVPYVAVAAKTGTAQVGVNNEYINSWMIGFFPYEHPRFAYAIVLERGPAGTLVGAPAAVRTFLDWLYEHAPQYLK